MMISFVLQLVKLFPKDRDASKNDRKPLLFGKKTNFHIKDMKPAMV